MKNFLRVLMFLVIAAAVVGTCWFLKNQPNVNIADDNNDNVISSQDINSGDTSLSESLDSNEIEITTNNSGEELTADNSGDLISSGETTLETSGDMNVQIESGDLTSETIESGEVLESGENLTTEEEETKIQ